MFSTADQGDAGERRSGVGSVTPFEVAIDDEVLADLRQRLAETRWPEEIGGEPWSYGADRACLEALRDHWLDEYDWRDHERAINAFDQFRCTIDDVPIHFIHRKGVGPSPLPIILSHGWPWTFWDYRKVIAPLADPAAFGGDPADAFDVVVPSLPGFGFSTPLDRSGVNFVETAELWVRLMRDAIGYPRFAAQGGDFGAMVTSQLGHAHPELLVGIHLHFLLPISGTRGGGAGFPEEADYAPEERSWFARNRAFLANETAYSALQRTRPQTLAYALNDSPVGLLAWITEKRRAWSDCDGDVARCFDKDDLVTTAMLYWLTESYGSSARFYAEAARQPWRASHDRMPVIEAPTSALIFPREVLMMPRAWVERYFNLTRWTVAERGGHFAPMEQPEVLVEDIRASFRPYRFH